MDHSYKWHAIYTRANHEKAVEKVLLENKIEAYLPKKRVFKTWSDRKKWIEEPIFKPYVFVRVSNKEYYKVLEIPSVLYYICFSGEAATIPDHQITNIKQVIDKNLTFEIDNICYLPKQKVEIIKGPLVGLKAEVITKKNRKQVVIGIKELNCSLLVEIDTHCLRSI